MFNNNESVTVKPNQIWHSNYRTDEIDEDSYYIILEVINNTHVLLRPLDLRELPYSYPISRLMEFYKYVQ